MDKPRIGIVGLLPQQQECINREFGDTFELRYWKDESTSALKALGRSCELVFITKWAGHSISETLTSIGATWRMVHGAWRTVRTERRADCAVCRGALR